MRLPNGDYEFTVGQKLGLEDLIEDSVDWYTILAIEQDQELPIAWFYLKSEVDKLNNKECAFGNYAEIIESISDRIIVTD